MDTETIKKMFDRLLMFKKSLIAFGLIIFSFVSYEFFIGPSEQAQNQISKIVEVEKLQLRNIKQTVDFIGVIKSGRQTHLKTKANGALSILSRSGEEVKKGELLAKIENNDIEHNYRISREAEKIARSQFERSNSLFKSGVSNKNAVEEARKLLLETQKMVSDAKIAFEEINIYAPFDGIVGLFKLRGGSHVQNGDNIVNFYDPTSLIVEFDIPLSIAKQVQDGNQVFINEKEYTLTHIQKMLDEETHMCPAYIEINCPDCIIGTAVDVNLVIQERCSVIVIPFEAIFLREGKSFVYIVKEDKAILTPLELGIRDKQLIEITSGLKEGDQVIVYGHNRLYPDVPVVIAPKDSTI